MAVIEQLRFYNAFTYRECVIPMSNQGFVYMGGKNGSGKSTPWEVLQHTIFGTTSRGLRKNGIVCTIPREDNDEERGFLSEVILSNEAGAYKGRWLVRQSRDHGKYKTATQVLKEVDGAWSKKWHDGACPKKLEDAQRLAAAILGLRQNEFEGCMYLNQSSTHTLIEGKPTEKAMYLSYLFGFDRYDDVLKVLKDRLSDVNKKLLDDVYMEGKLKEMEEELADLRPLDVLDSEVSMLREAKVIAARNMEECQTKRDSARDTLSEVDQREQLQADLNELGDVDTSGLEGIKKDLQALKDGRDEARDQVKTEELRTSLQAKVDELVDGIDESAYKHVDRDVEAKHKRRAELTTQISSLKDREAIEVELAALPSDLDLEGLEEQVTFVENSLAVIKEKYSEGMREHKELEAQLSEFKGGVCSKCKRPMDLGEVKKRRTELAAELRGLHTSMEAPKNNLVKYKQDLTTAKKVAELNTKLATFEVGDLGGLKAERAKLKTELTRLTDVQDKLIEANGLRAQFANLPQYDLAKLNQTIENAESRIPDLQSRSDKMSKAIFLEARIAKLTPASRDYAEEQMQLVELAYNEVSTERDEVNQSFVVSEISLNNRTRIEKDVADLRVKIATLEDTRLRQRVLQYAVVAVPKLKKRKLHKIVCAIRDVLPRYAGVMFSHEPNTSFVVMDDDGGSGESIDLLARRMVKVYDRMEPVLIPVKGFSGGEKQRLSVALLFTLHSLLDPSKKPDILILDEVDKGLDDLGVASLMSLVSEVKSQYGTVIMTSHRAQISGAKFDRIWRVEKINEESRLKLTAA